jgi:hypothetical protein
MPTLIDGIRFINQLEGNVSSIRTREYPKRSIF